MTDQPEALRVAQQLDDKWMGRLVWHVPTERIAARLLREQHEEIERLQIEREKMYNLGYEKGVTDTLQEFGVDHDQPR